MKFANIYRETEENVRLALLSLWTPGMHPMRPALERLFDEEPLLAEPVFQSTFGWEPSEDESWRDFINPEVFSAIEGRKERIAQDTQKEFRSFHPFKHQAKSWEALYQGKSIVVTSGTGSGKTECFMYPVLSDLYEQERTNTIQALFLYPLNALMEDQKKRLSEYCQATGLKFGVYNGNTPEYHEDGRNLALPQEVATREEIRDNEYNGTRPQILLTNPSMLEYILVRQRDQQMLQECAGQLRWIVIDEAHSYSGSAAVELAYQIKRILDAFQTDISQVRFVCTSATIGGEKGKQSLLNFISTLTGKATDDIEVIGGQRLIPALDEKELSNTLRTNHLPDIAHVINLRKRINEVPGMNLQQMWQSLCPEQEYQIIPALELLDQLCELKIKDKPVLSLRAHFFMRTISGLYACGNEHCQGTSETPYGHLTTYKGNICPQCGSVLMEFLQCKMCKSFIMTGNSDSQTHLITPSNENIQGADYFSIDPTPEEEFDDLAQPTAAPNKFFLLPHQAEYIKPVQRGQTSTFDIASEKEATFLHLNQEGKGKWIELQGESSSCLCPSCGRATTDKYLKHFRIPIDFINRTISPVLLKECAPQGKTWGKYIVFTDSRQGTAISAKTFNINVERILCRENIMQKLATPPKNNSSLLELLQNNIIDEATIQRIQQSLQTQQKHITLKECADVIVNKRIYHHITQTSTEDPIDPAYTAALLRQFIGRKPLYESNIETMGLVTLIYPGLNDISKPTSLTDYEEAHGFNISIQDWKDYLKLALDYFIRMGNHIQPLINGERSYVRDSNLSTPVAGPEDNKEGIIHWPSVRKNCDGSIANKQSRMVLLLCAGLGIYTLEELKVQARSVNNILKDAWNTLVQKKILKKVNADDTDGYNDPAFYPNNKYTGCYFLDLSGNEDNRTAQLERTQQAWICPVTGNLLDTLFCGFSPAIDGNFSKEYFERFRCTQTITMPERPAENEDVSEWLKHDEHIAQLQKAGLWSDRYKYTYHQEPPYIAAEHSAQQSRELLKEYTQEFSNSNPTINVLHCSTTMEMGVDIGDIDTVVMDTIPPTPANYLQRVGRAGRMGQTKSLAFSLCNNTLVGQYAFANPMWALLSSTPMTDVRKSKTIIQRHINSYFFRKYVCENGEGIKATMNINDFMINSYKPFVEFLNSISTNTDEKERFHKVFGNDIEYVTNRTIESIQDIHNKYADIIQELTDSFAEYAQDQRRQMAINEQLQRCEHENMLKYLSEQQFLPNANMPTGVVTFNFIDRAQAMKLNYLYNDIEEMKMRMEDAHDPTSRYRIEKNIIEKQTKMMRIIHNTSTNRDIQTALNEYAPGQTVVVNEKNYVSAGIILLGAYNERTQTKGIYHCIHCGHTEYLPQLDEHRICPICHKPYHGIIDRDHEGYTRAYEPIGFRTDQNKEGTREEKTNKNYYDIRPVLLETDWSNPIDLNMCEITSSDDAGTGNILFYNIGAGKGFAFCKHCGRATIEYARGGSENTIPDNIKPGNKRLIWGKERCDANNNDIARNVVLTGRHQTCYSVFRFKDKEGNVIDEQLAYSLGVVLTRALAKSEGIDENEVAFGVKQEDNTWLLFIYDTAKGGCGYSLKFTEPGRCQEIFDLARTTLEESPCHCEKEGDSGACTCCLIDRNNYRFANKLSKAKALEWLRQQKQAVITLPKEVIMQSPEAQIIYRSPKQIINQVISKGNTTKIILVASDSDNDVTVTDWTSLRSEMGKLISRAVENGINVTIWIEYHPEAHAGIENKLPYIDLKNKFPDCEVKFVQDMGKLKTILIVQNGNACKRFFTDQQEALSLSNRWGEECNYLFIDKKLPDVEEEKEPTYTQVPSEIVRDGTTDVKEFCIKNYFSEVIKNILKKEDAELMEQILKSQHVNINFSDMYVNSALASLMLTYLIKEMKICYQLTIDSITLQLDSTRRKCNNERFNDYTYINMNFKNKEDADQYTDDLIFREFGINAIHSSLDAGHHRWLRITTTNGDMVEIRPDHGISGGWRSKSTYMNLSTLNGNVRVFKADEDILYYVIIKKQS